MISPLIVHTGRTRLFRHLAPHVLPPCDLALHRLTGGRWLPSRHFLPTVLLTTTGHRSGRPHTTPLCAHRYEDGSWLVIATNFGRPRHPAWSTNLLHHPEATVTIRRRTQPVTARLLHSAEQQAERSRILAILPVYDQYAAISGRTIRAFHLAPVPTG